MPRHTKTRHGVTQTVEWEGGGRVFQTHDGNITIESGGRHRPVRVLRYSPAWDAVTRRNGAVVGLPGSWPKSAYAIDGRLNLVGARVDVPVELRAGDVMVIGKSAGAAGWDCSAYHGDVSSSLFETMLVVTVVDGDPGSVSSPALRPSAMGTNDLARLLRNQVLKESEIDVDALPKIIELGAFVNSVPSVAEIASIFADFSGDFVSGWETAPVTPGLQHPGYGTWLASVVSQGLVLLCSDLTNEQKFPLLRPMVQWGVDLTGAMVDGRVMFANGGHCLGRKALVLLAGKVLHQQALMAVDEWLAYLRPGDLYTFAENRRYFPSAWWFNTGATTDWISGWRFNGGSYVSPLSDGSQLLNAPATWGDPNSPTNSTWAWCVKNYLQPTVGADVGTALAMQLMGLEEQWNIHGVNMVRQYMDGPPGDADAVLTTAGIDIPWGTDYGAHGELGFSAEAWDSYADA